MSEHQLVAETSSVAVADRAAVARIRAGETGAFELIVARYRTPLTQYVRRRLTGSAHVDDVLQDVFLATYVRLCQTDAPMELRPWLYRCAHNACIDELRRPVHTCVITDQPDLAPGTADHVAWLLREAVQAVLSLPPRQARALAIRAVEGRSYREIASQLDLSESAVKALINRGRQQLRAQAALAEAA